MEIIVAALLVISLLLESCASLPTSEPQDSRQDALMLLLAIHSLVLGEEDAEDAGLGPNGSGVLLRPAVLPAAGPIEEVKAAIQVLDAECAQERVAIQNTLPEADMGAAIAGLDQVCQAELSRLRAVLSDLRAQRKGHRFRHTLVGKGLAGVWKFVKQTVRGSGPEILLALATGGGGIVVKRILIAQGRAGLRKEVRTALGRALARKGVSPELLKLVNLSPGTWPPRKPGTEDQTASGKAEDAAEDQTAPGEAEGAAEAQAVIEDFSTTDFELPADGLWTAVCRHRHPEDWTIKWTLAINLMASSFTSHAEWTRAAVEQGGWLYSYQLAHEGLGEIAKDGMLEGPFREITTLVWRKEGVVSDPQETAYEGRMYGVISADLKTICISRGEDPGAYDVDYIRRIGREAFFGPDAGCEAECIITQEP
jgi:hypothetical protein